MNTRWSVAGRRCGAVVAALLLGGTPAGAVNLVVNGDFADGLDGWTTVVVTPSGEYPKIVVQDWSACVPARHGDPHLALDVPGASEGYATQELTLPTAPTTLTLVSWGNLSATTVTVSIQTLGDGVVHDLEAWTPPTVESFIDCSGEVPVGKAWDLSAFAGQTVALRLRALGSWNNGVIANFDDVTIDAPEPETTTTTSAVPTTTSSTTTTMPALCGGLAAADAVACLCRADLPDVCSAVAIPKRISRRYEAICRTSQKALDAGATRKARRRLGKAGRQMHALIRAVGKLDVSADCRAAMVERGEAVDARIDEARAAITP